MKELKKNRTEKNFNFLLPSMFGQMGFKGQNNKSIYYSYFRFLSNLGGLKFAGQGEKSPIPFSFPLHRLSSTKQWKTLVFSPLFLSSLSFYPNQT